MVEPMRIVHVIGSLVKGGVEAVVFNYYRAIDRSQIQFDFIVDEDSPYEVPSDIIELGCRVYKIPSYKHPLSYIKSLKAIFFEGEYQIVHSHMNTLSVFTLFAAKWAGVPVRIAHNHSTAGRGEFMRNVMKYSLRPFAKLYPTHYFACSEYAGRWLFGNRAFEKGKVTVIRNAIDTEKFRFKVETRDRVRRMLGIEDKFVVGHVGRFVTVKNHAFLLSVFTEVHRRNSKSVLLLVGDGELLPAVEEKTKRLGLMDCVMFMGARDDVHELYQAMDVFAFPSIYEGFGIVVLEAKAAGLQCVISNSIDTQVLSSTNSTGYCLKESISLWADAVLSVSGSSSRGEVSDQFCKNWDVANEVELLSRFFTSTLF